MASQESGSTDGNNSLLAITEILTKCFILQIMADMILKLKRYNTKIVMNVPPSTIFNRFQISWITG